MDEEDLKKIEDECEKNKKHTTCEEFLRKIPKKQIKEEIIKQEEEKKKKITFEEEARKKALNIKAHIERFSKPKGEKRHEDIFKYCTTHEPPCNLECLYGQKLVDEDEKVDKVIKERIYTKQGAIYDTMAYRLPDDFAVGPVPKTKEDECAAEKKAQLAEEPWFEAKKKKKKKKPEMLEFSGPVKIKIVEREGFLTSYTAKRIHAAVTQLSYMFIGATVILIYFYCLQFRKHYSSNLHIICFTVAFLFCLPASLLVRNKQCVAGSVMSTKHTFQHSLIFKSITMVTIIGCGLMLKKWLPVLPMSIYTKHALWGYAACGLATAEYILNLLAAYGLGHDRGFLVDCYLHILAVAAIATGFYCFILAFEYHKPLFLFINYTHWHYWTFAMTGIFIVTAIFRTCMDCVFHLWNYSKAVAMWCYYFVRPHDPCTVRIPDVENPFNLINKVERGDNTCDNSCLKR